MKADRSLKILRLTTSIWIWLMLAVTSVVTQSHAHTSRNLRLCGSELADALDLVCRSNFNTDARKRAEFPSILHLKTAIRSPIFRVRRSNVEKRGPNAECCQSYSGCNFETLQSYCQEPLSEFSNIHLFPIFREQDNGATETTTTADPSPFASVPTTSRPAVFESNRRKFGSFFFVNPTRSPTRNPMQA